QKHEYGDEEHREARDDDGELGPAPLHRLTREQVLEAVQVQVQALEREEREEEPSLVLRDGSDEAARFCGVLLDERNGVDIDVGILAYAIRVGVVPRMLGVPPGIAHADAPRERDGEAVVRGPERQDLTVRGLVREERDLREDDPERTRDEELE